jgi:predicted nucleic acid-binding protein
VHGSEIFAIMNGLPGMTDPIIIDTDILIDAGRGVREAADCLTAISQRISLAVSVITYMELMIGCRSKRELNELDRFLSRFQIIQMNNRISGTASDLLHDYRLSHGLLIPDALIAATAIVLECPFVSKNQRDYRFIGDLNLLSYPNLFS